MHISPTHWQLFRLNLSYRSCRLLPLKIRGSESLRVQSQVFFLQYNTGCHEWTISSWTPFCYKLNVVICKQGVYINRLITKGFRRAKFEFWSTLLACVYVRKVSINRIMANTAIANDLDQKFFSELVEPLVQPLLIHMVAPFVNGDDKNFSLQINGKILKGWKKLEGNLKKLFAALQANLRSIGYTLEESAFDRVVRTNE